MVGGGEVEMQLLGWLLAPGRAAGRAAPDRRTDRKVRSSFHPQAGASEGCPPDTDLGLQPPHVRT